MVAIARTLMTNPSILLLDEPLEGLAPIIVEELAAAIRRMADDGDMALVLVEQHAELALEVDRASGGHRAWRSRPPGPIAGSAA